MKTNRSKLARVMKVTGYSIATVSRALNEETAPMVKEPTRESIRRAAEKLGYIPNRTARSLRTRRANTLGFLLNFETDTVSGYSHEILNGIINGLKGGKYDLKIVSSFGHAGLEEIIRIHGLDGLILPYGFSHEFPMLAQESQRYSTKAWPVVLINDPSPRYHMSQVYSDNYHASQCLTEHIIKEGHKRFFLIGCGEDSPDSGARKKAFLNTLKKHNIPFDADRDIANGYFSEKGGYEATFKLLSERPKYRGCLFCMNDSMALGAIRAVGEAGLKCPETIAVTGFDGIAAGEFSNPPLTTIKFELHEMGKAAVGILKEIINGRQRRFIKKKFPFRLIERRSC